MKLTIEQIAADFIAYALYEPIKAPSESIATGWEIYDLVYDNPLMAWETIKYLVNCYPEDDYYSSFETKAQRIIGRLAAGPIEDLLGAHGSIFIEAAEQEARRDRRMAWALGGVWRVTMTDEIWARVQGAADYSWWRRSVAK